MRVFPKTVANRANVRNRVRLETWLSEWALDKSIRKAAFPGPSGDSDGPAAALAGSNGSCHFVPAEGHVIILPPVSTTLVEGRLLYVLVLKQVSDVFLVVPFSRFSTPATDHEWKTGLQAKPLRVLCLWNERTLSARALSGGWQAMHLAPRQHAQAVKAYDQCRGAGGSCGDGLATAFGPPLRNPLDPRHEYLAEEAALMDEHLQEMVLRKHAPELRPLYEQVAAPRLKAAEERSDYGRRDGNPVRRKRARRV